FEDRAVGHAERDAGVRRRVEQRGRARRRLWRRRRGWGDRRRWRRSAGCDGEDEREPHVDQRPGESTIRKRGIIGHPVSEEDLKFAVVALSAIFFVIDPLANVPIFLSITNSFTPEQRRKIAGRAAFATWITLSVFALAGGLIFKAFGISLGAFKIAGGLMLLLMSVDMMRAQPSPTRTTVEEQAEGRTRDDVALFPMAIPMLAGPGAIATVMVLMSRA